jgi:hypothetical protein
MSGMGDLIGLGVLVIVVAGGWTLLQSGALNFNPSPIMTPIQSFTPTIPSTTSRSSKSSVGGGGGSQYSGGGGGSYDTSGCNYSGYKGTPGWYTAHGHHHCTKAQGVSRGGDCVCTDPKKCYGHSGTGSQYCRQNPQCCVPGPGECAWWYSGDQKYCSLCEAGTAYKGHVGMTRGC